MRWMADESAAKELPIAGAAAQDDHAKNIIHISGYTSLRVGDVRLRPGDDYRQLSGTNSEAHVNGVQNKKRSRWIWLHESGTPARNSEDGQRGQTENFSETKKMKSHVDITWKPPVALSLCTGMRGLERGVENFIRSVRYGDRFGGRQGESVLKIAAVLEVDPFIVYNLVCAMEEGVVDSAPIWIDLKTFPYKQFHRKIHLLTGGYPCQPFSSAGQQRGVLDPRHLWPYIEEGIAATRPVLCFFENVVNHLNIGYEEVRASLRRLGYQVKEGIFSAETVGAPHLRKRLFILAVANSYCDEQGTGRRYIAEMLGISQAQRQPEFGAALSGRDGDELGDSDHQREQQRGWNLGESRRRIDDSGENVEHSESSASSRGIRNVSGEDDEIQKSEEPGKGRTEHSGNAGENVEDSSIIGTGGRENGNSRGQRCALQTSGSGSPLDYAQYGAKTSIVHLYPPPKNEKIIEPFAGTARYALEYWEKEVTLVDKYEVIIKIWKWLQQCSPKDILSLPKFNAGDNINDFNYDCDEQRLLIGFTVGFGFYEPRHIATVRLRDRPNHQPSRLKFIAENLHKIRHWKIIHDSYESLPDQTATWFIDPPYQHGGHCYKWPNKKIDYQHLAEWCRTRQGQVIVCENMKATWMDFKPMVINNVRSGRTSEAIWLNSVSVYDNVQTQLFA